MSALYLVLAGVLLVLVIAGFWRVIVGPDPEDRLIAAQLLGTTAVAILLLLGEAVGTPSLRYVGLVFAALATVTVVAYVRLGIEEPGVDTDGPR